ncbi:uncharacterized mitochondrial protein AtMg00810-like [Nicotiana sylvestris]|uniref:uncharacterized mitochondrial protein AtMg00810-like n=1 Tax=Nicotiana sylvestris TaxID=4096 RepID=UPI00388CE0EE
MSTVKSLIVVAVKQHWPLFQLNVNNFASYSSPSMVCDRLPDNGMLNYLRGSGSFLVILAVYVDDIILTGTDLSEISSLRGFLHEKFRIKDLDPLNYFLGIGVLYCDSGVLLHQKKFIHDLLELFASSASSSVVCPLDINEKLKASVGDPFPKPEEYRCLAALHLLRYLKRTSHFGLFFSNSPNLSLKVYCDSDWASCVDSRRSVTGFCVFLGDCLVSWKSKKQLVVYLSTAEAEYRVVSKAAGEVTWLSRLLSDFGLPFSSPIPLCCDNQAALHIARNPVFHERTKHIELDCHFVRGKIGDGLISLGQRCSSC